MSFRMLGSIKDHQGDEEDMLSALFSRLNILTSDTDTARTRKRRAERLSTAIIPVAAPTSTVIITQPQRSDQFHQRSSISNRRVARSSPYQIPVRVPTAGPSAQTKRKFKWQDLDYNGAEGSSVANFIFKFEALADESGIVEDHLVGLIFGYVSGEALQYLWNIVREGGNVEWPKIKQGLLSCFGGKETDRQTRCKLRRLIQGQREPVRGYLLNMKQLNSQLRHPYTDAELLGIMKQNLHPAFKNASVTLQIDSIDMLKKVCEELEQIWNSGSDERQLYSYRAKELWL